MNTPIKELKESLKVEEISWNISNRIREFGNASMYGGFCLAYVAYVSLKNKITDREVKNTQYFSTHFPM